MLSDDADDDQPKLPFEASELVEYSTVEELTRGTGGPGADGGSPYQS